VTYTVHAANWAASGAQGLPELTGAAEGHQGHWEAHLLGMQPTGCVSPQQLPLRGTTAKSLGTPAGSI
jgi:hypothetical protein